jgi:hypothetical protein
VNVDGAYRGAGGSVGVRMDYVGEGQGQVCVRALEARKNKDVDPDSRDVVLGRKRKSGCLSTSRPVTSDRLLTYPNFTPLPASYKPAWVALFTRLCARAKTVLQLLRQHGSSLPNILAINKVQWASRCAMYTTFRKPHTFVKLFFQPPVPIPCEFLVKEEPTKGMLEGVELFSDKPMMRIHLSYPSWHRAKQLQQLKMAFVRGAPNMTNGDHLREIWSMVFPHPKVGRGYEYVSRLIRFGPSARKKNGRRPAWTFHGVYSNLSASDRDSTALLKAVHFMVKYARRDRSVNQIRVVPTCNAKDQNGSKCTLNVF